MITELESLLTTLKHKLPDFIQEHVGTDPFKKFKCICPTHDDSSPSAQIHKDGGFFKCFSCGYSGDIFVAANALLDYPLDGPEFITENVYKLADKYGIKYNILSKNDPQRTAVKHAYLRAYKIVADLVQETAKENPTDSWESEIKKRKWKRKESYELGVGCVHKFQDVLNTLLANGFSKEFIDLSGLMRPDIFNGDGIIFTIYDEYNRPIAFYMRDTKFEEKKAVYDSSNFKNELVKPKPPMKYNSTANYTGIYEKPLFPYGLNDVKNFHKIILVEGHGCKHNLRLNGIDNVIALGGLELNEQTITKLSTLGVTQIVLLLDNDVKGREKIKSIIRRYYGKIPVDISILDMSMYNDVKDPDEFLRKYGKELFNTISERNALEWLAINELAEKGEPYTVLQDISPLIAQEKSPISRLKIINMIAEMTGIPRDVITEEVDQKISASKDRKGEFALKVLDEARELITMNPGALDAAVNLIESKIGSLNKASQDDDSYSSLECLKGIVKLQDVQDSGEKPLVITTGYADWDRFIPMPYSEAFSIFPAPPNAGKTQLFINRVLRELECNEDHMCIMFTNDDSRDIYVTRSVACLSRVKINWVSNPKTYLDEDKTKARREAYNTITEYVRSERLIIKDITHGNTVEYLGRLIQFYRDKYPNRTLSVWVDNLHRVGTEADIDEGRFKVAHISGLMKSYTTKYACNIACTVELTKDTMYQKPTDARSIKEAAELQYDANLIVFLWNELNCLREAAELVFESSVMEYVPDVGYIHRPENKPIIECLVLKNKLSEYKGSLHFKLHGELAICEDITCDEVRTIRESAKKVG